MLTARAEPENRVEGLEAGVDDYVTKPFEPRELVLRLQNIMRRGRIGNEPRDEIRMGDYAFSIERGELQARRRDDQAHRARARSAAPVRVAPRLPDRAPRARER